MEDEAPVIYGLEFQVFHKYVGCLNIFNNISCLNLNDCFILINAFNGFIMHYWLDPNIYSTLTIDQYTDQTQPNRKFTQTKPWIYFLRFLWVYSGFTRVDPE